MGTERLARRLLFAGGVIELLVATGHFLMLFSIQRTAGAAGLPAEFANLTLLCTAAVGICMIAFGAIAIYLAQRVSRNVRTAQFFSLSQCFLWTARVLLEWVWPVRVPLFSLPEPTTFVGPMVTGIALLFLIASLAFSRNASQFAMGDT